MDISTHQGAVWVSDHWAVLWINSGSWMFYFFSLNLVCQVLPPLRLSSFSVFCFSCMSLRFKGLKGSWGDFRPPQQSLRSFLGVTLEFLKFSFQMMFLWPLRRFWNLLRNFVFRGPWRNLTGSCWDSRGYKGSWEGLRGFQALMDRLQRRLRRFR